MKGQNLSSIVLEDGIAYSHMIDQLAVVLYRTSEVKKVVQLLTQVPQGVLRPTLIKRGQIYWIVRPCEAQNAEALQEIERLGGLGQTMICIELSNSLEAFIEKVYCNAQNQLLSAPSHHQLLFIKDIYKEKQSISDIKYFQTIQKAQTLLNKGHVFSIRPIQVADLLQLYDCQFAENIPQVSTIHQKYETIRQKQSKIIQAEQLVFDLSRSKAQVSREIKSLKLSKQKQDKLLWKIQQYHRFQHWITEEDHTARHNHYKKMTFNELNQRIGLPTVLKHHHEWTANSLEVLKKQFNKIGSKKDIVAIREFHRLYKSMLQNLQAVRKDLLDRPETQLFEQMTTDLKNFFIYHDNVIEGLSLSSLHFIKEDAQYLWRFKNNFYKKLAVFGMLGGLAYLQSDLIWAFTLLILAFLVLTLRI